MLNILNILIIMYYQKLNIKMLKLKNIKLKELTFHSFILVCIIIIKYISGNYHNEKIVEK